MTIAPHNVRRAGDRGVLDLDWLQARFSFSFSDYQDPNHVHWGALRAINDDRVAPGRGFGWHAHRDIESLTWPLAGAIRHRDSLGNDYTYGRWQLHHLSAGRGIEHSEMNASDTESERHLQIWFYPGVRAAPPACALIDVEPRALRNRWRLLASPDGRDGSAALRQNALLYASVLAPHRALRCALAEHRLGYLHVVDGALEVNDELVLGAGDGLRFTHHEPLRLRARGAPVEVLMFDL